MDATQPGPVNTGNFQVQTQWLGNPGVVPQPVNQMLLQLGIPVQRSDGGAAALADEVVVSFGHVTPPLFATQEEAQAAFARGERVLVATVAQMEMSRARLESFRDSITAFLDALDVEAGAR